MKVILSCALILLLAGFEVTAESLQAFEDHEVVPDVIARVPAALARVVFPSGVEASLGNELTPTEVRDTPTVTWDSNDGEFYTLIMTDPDAPSRAEPTGREFQHWLVGNIQGGDVAGGEVFNPFIGSGPPIDTGLHRYVFLVYRQPGWLEFDEPSDGSIESRRDFSTINFAAKYKLGDPVAGNFYQAQYEE